MKKRFLCLSLLLLLTACSPDSKAKSEILNIDANYYSYNVIGIIKDGETQILYRYNLYEVDTTNLIEHQYGYTTNYLAVDNPSGPSTNQKSFDRFLTSDKKYELDSDKKYQITDQKNEIAAFKVNYDLSKVNLEKEETNGDKRSFSGSVKDEDISSFFKVENIDAKNLKVSGEATNLEYYNSLVFSYTTLKNYNVQLTVKYSTSISNLILPNS